MNTLEENLSHQQSLESCVTNIVNNYLDELDGDPTVSLYQLIIDEMDSALLEVIMKRTRLNQSEAARQLGVARGTLRKKLRVCFGDRYIG